MIHHAMPTTNCNTSNTWEFDPFNPPTSGSQHLLAPHLIHGTVEQRIHVLLLLLTNLPLACVAPTGGYVGALQVGRCSRNPTGDCRPSSLTCFEPWHRPSRPADQHWVLERRSETLESILVALFFGRLR